MFHVEQVVERLLIGAGSLKMALSSQAAGGMAIQLEMLAQWNAKLNLVGPGDPEMWLSRHSLDSLVPELGLPAGSSVVDVGSGAGFPGIPLALVRPDSRFWLAERRGKRRAFLQNVIAAVKAPNIVVIGSPEVAQPYDCVLGRAVLPAGDWLSYGANLARPGGRVGLFAQHDAADPTEKAANAGLRPVGEREYALPGESPRRFWWFEKASST